MEIISNCFLDWADQNEAATVEVGISARTLRDFSYLRLFSVRAALAAEKSPLIMRALLPPPEQILYGRTSPRLFWPRRSWKCRCRCLQKSAKKRCPRCQP